MGVKKFRLVIPQKSIKIAPPEVKLEELPSIKLGSPTRPNLYHPLPNNDQWYAVNYRNRNPVSRADYSQHRQQDMGRAIALKRVYYERLISHVGNEWKFRQRKYKKGEGEKVYTVNWDGKGLPQAGQSDSTYSTGRTYVDSYGETVTYYGKPDKYTYAVWFLVNGIPPDDLWLPTPSRYPNFPLQNPPWAEYPNVVS